MSFTPFQRLIAQHTLDAIADLGFALGGGQALHAHGLGDRLSLDLDFYVTRFDQDLFDRAETATLTALRELRYQAEVGHSDTWLRQIIVTDPATGEQVLLDLGQDYRQHPPIVITGLGPVIDLPDAAASKARALNDRRAARDYLDLHALLTQPGWTPARLFAATAGPVVHSNQSFTVAGWVRLTAKGANRALAMQNGTNQKSFVLYYDLSHDQLGIFPAQRRYFQPNLVLPPVHRVTAAEHLGASGRGVRRARRDHRAVRQRRVAGNPFGGEHLRRNWLVLHRGRIPVGR